MRNLEGHTDAIFSVSFSADGRLLASKSADGTVRFWNAETGETLAIIDEVSSSFWTNGLAFHPALPILATLAKEDKQIHIWDLDLNTIFHYPPIPPNRIYTTAKVVLVGDIGVGKSSLALALTGQPFIPTMSTHGHHVWMFDRKEVELSNGRKETREIFLWDLAGQSEYHLTHQLQFNEVAVALVIFNPLGKIDPFASVYYWCNALRQIQLIQGTAAPPIMKFLVAARIDRGTLGVSQTRIDMLVSELGFDGYFETSALEGVGVKELQKAIQNAIDWEALPKVSSTALFENIKEFL